jgi:hypothetical protein
LGVNTDGVAHDAAPTCRPSLVTLDPTRLADLAAISRLGMGPLSVIGFSRHDVGGAGRLHLVLESGMRWRSWNGQDTSPIER